MDCKRLLIVLLIIIIIVITVITVSVFKKYNNMELFEDYSVNLDNVDEIYAKLYNIVFNEKLILDYDTDKIKKTLTKDSIILDAGTGTGKYFEYFFKNHKIVGVDLSKELLKYAKIRCPMGNFMIGNLKNSELYQSKKFSHVLCLLDTLYHNDYESQATILENFHKWLKPDGYLFLHVLNYKKLIPSPRNYSTLYLDDYKNVHSYTEFNKFSHDAYYIRKEDYVIYREKIKMSDNNNSRFHETKLYIPKIKDKTIKQALEAGFEIKNIYKMGFYDDTDIELYMLKKK
tara:strand:- start:3408 stop:4268 length:861 start_codon:yes stop_codon:yes gene_type:complete